MRTFSADSWASCYVRLLTDRQIKQTNSGKTVNVTSSVEVIIDRESITNRRRPDTCFIKYICYKYLRLLSKGSHAWNYNRFSTAAMLYTPANKKKRICTKFSKICEMSVKTPTKSEISISSHNNFGVDLCGDLGDLTPPPKKKQSWWCKTEH